MGELSWDDLDAMVEGDPLVLRDRAWQEIHGLRQENAQLRAENAALRSDVEEIRAVADQMIRNVEGES